MHLCLLPPPQSPQALNKNGWTEKSSSIAGNHTVAGKRMCTKYVFSPTYRKVLLRCASKNKIGENSFLFHTVATGSPNGSNTKGSATVFVAMAVIKCNMHQSLDWAWQSPQPSTSCMTWISEQGWEMFIWRFCFLPSFVYGGPLEIWGGMARHSVGSPGF